MLYDAEVEKAVLYAIIFEEAELNIQEKDLSNILELRDLETGKSLNLKNNEIIITDKLADLTGSKKGDELTFKD